MLRSTPLRLIVVLGLAFVVALIIAGVAAFELIRQELLARIDRNVLDTYSVISQSYGEKDPTDLTDSVLSHIGATLQHDRVYALSDREGDLLAGNVTAIPPGSGWSTASAAALGVSDAGDDYRLYIGEVDGYRLLVGASFGETNAIRRLTVTSLSWAGGLFVLVVLVTGLVVAARGQQRLDSIAETMHRVARGELGARIARSGRTDDIDALIGSVNAALDRLSALVEGMRQVSVDIAHDLKTPLNRLSMAIGRAAAAGDAGERAELLAQAEADSQQINATFDALLRIAQIEAGARRARFTRVDPKAVVDAIADAYGEVAIEHGHVLSVALPDTMPAIAGDKDLLVQMLANLVENALRHGAPGTRIALGATIQDGAVVLSIADTGPGIPEAERDKVFQRLYRLEKSRTTSGHGLGLSLVKAIVELHGASITLGDNGPGLVVTIAFPAAERVAITNL